MKNCCGTNLLFDRNSTRRDFRYTTRTVFFQSFFSVWDFADSLQIETLEWRVLGERVSELKAGTLVGVDGVDNVGIICTQSEEKLLQLTASWSVGVYCLPTLSTPVAGVGLNINLLPPSGPVESVSIWTRLIKRNYRPSPHPTCCRNSNKRPQNIWHTFRSECLPPPFKYCLQWYLASHFWTSSEMFKNNLWYINHDEYETKNSPFWSKIPKATQFCSVSFNLFYYR